MVVLAPAVPRANPNPNPNPNQEERQCQQWEQLVSGVHDAGQSKGNPWWATIEPELSSLAESS